MNSPTHTPPESDIALSSVESAELDAALGQLKQAMDVQRTPDRVTQALKSAMQTQIEQTRRQRWQARVAHWFAPGLGLAASVGMAAWITLLPAPLDPVNPVGPPPVMTDTPFIALRSLESIAVENKPRLIQTEMPRMWLAEFGIAVNPETANERIQAEMLVGATGQPLAVRFVP